MDKLLFCVKKLSQDRPKKSILRQPLEQLENGERVVLFIDDAINFISLSCLLQSTHATFFAKK